MQSVNSLLWQPTGDTQRGDYVATVIVDGDTDRDWRIFVTRSVESSSRELRPAFVTFDNIANTNAIRVTFGPFSFIVPQFKRNVFSFPGNTNEILIESGGGQTRVILTENKVANDEVNDFALSSLLNVFESVPVASPLVNISFGQRASDTGKVVIFNPTAAAIDFTLLETVANGFFSFVKNIGTQDVSIKPFGAQTINNFWTNASPFVLPPAGSGLLISDGSEWYFVEGANVAYETIGILVGTFHATVDNVFPYVLEKEPTEIELCIRCLVTNSNWTAGDVATIQRWSNDIAGLGINNKLVSMFVSGSDIHVLNLGGNFYMQNKITAANFVPTSPNWEMFVRYRL